MTAAAAGVPLLALTSISKSFGPVRVLDDVSVALGAGEVHAILGANGAGKTTLMRIAYGMLAPDAGQIAVAGERRTAISYRIRSPREARVLGIGMVHQHFTSIAGLSVAENVALAAGWRETGRRAERRVATLLAELGMPLDPADRTGVLSVQLRQRLEIVQALASQARILLLDEPTAVLAPREVAELMTLIRAFADRGGAVALITHKLREVRQAADRVTVLRDGTVTLAGSLAEHDDAELSRAMIGGEATRAAAGTDATSPVAGRGEVRVDGMTWHAGEVIGVAAIEGNGQRELLRTIAGVATAPRPGVVVHGSVAFIPEDRIAEGLIGEFTLGENLALGELPRLPRWLDWRAIDREAATLIDVAGVRAAGPSQPAGTLSGGNQQRFILARAFAGDPDVVVAEDPTRGLDIAATAAVHARLKDAARAGACVVVHSSDLDEVLEIADRLVVLHDGHLVELSPDTPRALVGDRMLGLGAGNK